MNQLSKDRDMRADLDRIIHRTLIVNTDTQMHPFFNERQMRWPCSAVRIIIDDAWRKDAEAKLSGWQKVSIHT
jgi:hypothetical protein